MSVPVHVKPTKSNVAWPTPPANKIQSTDAVGPDRIIQGRLPYRRTGPLTDPALLSKPRVIIPHNGKSFAAPPL